MGKPHSGYFGGRTCYVCNPLPLGERSDPSGFAVCPILQDRFFDFLLHDRSKRLQVLFPFELSLASKPWGFVRPEVPSENESQQAYCTPDHVYHRSPFALM